MHAKARRHEEGGFPEGKRRVSEVFLDQIKDAIRGMEASLVADDDCLPEGVSKSQIKLYLEYFKRIEENVIQGQIPAREGRKTNLGRMRIDSWPLREGEFPLGDKIAVVESNYMKLETNRDKNVKN
ncbi:hypothetical protein C8024_17920 [Sphingopyxis sp. BSNA05]|nr:hypothetical protein [Sphingopyxis sp. BSNA05]